MQGGGWCLGRDLDSLLDDCLGRTEYLGGVLTSSNTWPNVAAGVMVNQFYPYNFGLFQNWNKFFFRYCDSTGHQGYLKDPIHHKGMDLFFRGHNITLSGLDWILKLSPPQYVDTFVLNGCSAGALATYTWVDYFRDVYVSKNPQIKFFGLPDSGFFLDFKNIQTNDNDYTIKIRNVYNLVNAQTPFPNQKCVKAHPEDPWKCFMSPNLVYFIDTPTFIIDSQYDTWAT